MSPGSGTPTGNVTFDDGSTVLGTFTLTNGTASFTTSSLAVGTHSIKAVYAGDANFKTSTSAVLKQVVNSSSDEAVAMAMMVPPSLVDNALSTLGDETLTDALVSDLASLQTSMTPAKAARAAPVVAVRARPALTPQSRQSTTLSHLADRVGLRRSATWTVGAFVS